MAGNGYQYLPNLILINFRLPAVSSHWLPEALMAAIGQELNQVRLNEASAANHF